MTASDQALIREAWEESEDEEHEDVGAFGRDEESDDGEGERCHSPSHLPFAPSSELLDTTTVDPSYIISLIRKLLPNNISSYKSSQNIAYNSSPLETSKACPLEENIDVKSNCSKKAADVEVNSNTGPHNILNDKFEGSMHHHFIDQTYSSTSIYNEMAPDSRKEDTASDDHESGFLHKENVWEDSGCILWDLSASRTHAEYMVNNYLLEVLLASLQVSNSPRIMEICLGILGNLACHDATNNVMSSRDALIETVVGQLYLDDAPCLVETFRLLTVALQGNSSTLWAKALLPEQTCLRINWIMGNTLNTMLLEKIIELLLTVVNNKEVASILLLPWIKLGLPNLVLNLLSSEMSNLDDDNKPVRMSFLNSVLCLVEALSTNDSDLELFFPNEELCLLVCRVFKLPDKFEYVGAFVSAVVIIANLLVDGQHIASLLFQDLEFIQGLLEAIPFVSDDPQARGAFWCILESLFVQIAEKDINISSLCHLVSLFLEKFSLIMEDLDGHYVEDSNPLNSVRAGSIVKTLLRIDGILERWLARKIEKIEDTSSITDAEAQAERLLCYCKKYSSLLSTPNVQE